MIFISSYLNTILNRYHIPKHGQIPPRPISKKREQKILIVEDNIINQKIEVIFLNHFGYKNVEIASSGNEAITKCLTIKYSLILLDIGLPDMNGFKVCQEIRKNYVYQSIPIIAISAYTKKDIEDKCIISGINEVISKPIFISELKIVINKFLEGP